jgi:predicted DNA-binding transcriptional regulator AlpA
MFLQRPSQTNHVGLLTAKQAARYLSISTKWLANQRWQGTGPRFLKVGGAVRYRQSDLDSYLAGCEASNSDFGGHSD